MIQRLCLILAAAWVTAAGGMEMQHEHTPREIPEDVLTPAITLTIARDDMDGYNLLIELDDFIVEPPGTTEKRRRRQVVGHLHVYVNGIKRMRLYGLAAHLPEAWFRPGINQVTVSMNSHSHETWAVDGKPLLATLFIDPTKPTLVQHHFTSSPPGNKR